MAKVKWLQFNFIKFEGGRHSKLVEWKTMSVENITDIENVLVMYDWKAV